MKDKIKKLTSVSKKLADVPLTRKEQYEKLKKKNPAIEKLRETFGLDIEL